MENNQTCLKLFARDASYLIQRFRKSSGKQSNLFEIVCPRRILSYPKIPKLAQIRIQSGGIMQVRGVERRGRRHPPPVPEARQPLSKTKPDGSGACPPSGRGVEPSGSFDFAGRAVRFRRTSRLPRHLPGKPSVEDWCYNATFTLSSPTFII